MKGWRPLLLASALVLAGCGGTDWPEPAPALWQVTSPDGDKGWLFGTVHALPDGVEWRTPVLDQAFDEADLLLVEIADLEDGGQSAQLFNRLGGLQGPSPLLARFPSGEERRRIEVLLDEAGSDEGDFAAMETWAAALMLSNAVSRGDPANGVDRALLASGKPAIGLESYQSQFAVFDRLPEGEQQDLLLVVACEAEASDPDAGIAAWLAGDIGSLERLASLCLLGDQELRAALLDGRNAAWIDRIVASTNDGQQPFVAVGAAHMLGQGGLPALLAARGFTVKRLQ